MRYNPGEVRVGDDEAVRDCCSAGRRRPRNDIATMQGTATGGREFDKAVVGGENNMDHDAGSIPSTNLPAVIQEKRVEITRENRYVL
jgi:hypothetical protein